MYVVSCYNKSANSIWISTCFHIWVIEDIEHKYLVKLNRKIKRVYFFSYLLEKLQASMSKLDY